MLPKQAGCVKYYKSPKLKEFCKMLRIVRYTVSINHCDSDEEKPLMEKLK